MYENENFEGILKRMLDRISNSRDKREGSVIWDTNASVAVELQLIYIALEDILNESFGDTASRQFLIRRAKERGITPFPATNAVLQGEFTPSDVEVIGRRFSMPNATLSYIVEERISDGVYKVRCEQLGSEGNQFLGSLLPLGGSVPRLKTAELIDILVPAQDIETTESIRQRYFDSFDEKAFGGNIRDYLVNTKAIEGVGAVKVTPVWNGGGTVKLTILDAQYKPASDVLISNVQEIIDPTQDQMGLGLAPIGHVVTVTTATQIPVNISTDLIFSAGFTWEIVQHQVIEILEQYLLELRQDWDKQDVLTPLGLFENPLVIRISHIDSRILAIQGIVDIKGTTINGKAENLEIDKYSIPVFGGIEI